MRRKNPPMYSKGIKSGLVKSMAVCADPARQEIKYPVNNFIDDNYVAKVGSLITERRDYVGD